MSRPHAILSASSSSRWLNCTPSARLEETLISESSEAAKEGTDAHALSEYKLRLALGEAVESPVEGLTYYDEEMEEHSESYVSYVLESLSKAKEKCKDPIVLIEERLDFSKYVPDGFGTGDCIIVSDDELHIIDFKYGMGVLVDSTDNSQMKLYALGALGLFEDLYDIQTVKMTIFQPRRENVSVYEMSAHDLINWAEGELKEKAKKAFHGEGEMNVGEWCKFCKASPKCRKRAEVNLKLAEKEFKKPALLENCDIEEILKQIPDLTKWANDVLSYATEMAVNKGTTWNGFKLVEGRSNRKYKDEEKVAEVLKENGYTDIYHQKLFTLTEVEKLLGKNKFKEMLGSLIYKPKGKLSLVPNTDKRKKVEVSNVNKEFKVEKEKK